MDFKNCISTYCDEFDVAKREDKDAMTKNMTKRVLMMSIKLRKMVKLKYMLKTCKKNIQTLTN